MKLETRRFNFPVRRSGEFYGPVSTVRAPAQESTYAITTSNDDNLFVVPFVVAQPMRIDNLVVRESGGVSGDGFRRMGIYLPIILRASSQWVPHQLLAQSAEQTLTTAVTTFTMLACNVALGKGVYFLAVAHSITSGTYNIGRSLNDAAWGIPSDAGLAYQGTRFGAFTYTPGGNLPDPAPVLTDRLNEALLLSVRPKSLN